MKSSKVILDHLLQERKFQRCPRYIRMAIRRWVVKKYLPCVWTGDFSAKDEQLVHRHTDFVAYVEREMASLLRSEVGQVLLQTAYETETFGEPCGSVLPWFLRRSKAELEENRRRHETLM